MTLFYRCCWTAARLAFKALGRTKIIGHENIPKSGAVIIAANHLSYLDPPLIGSSIKRECVFLGRHTLWNNRFLGWVITRCNCLPVNRDRPDRAAIRAVLDKLAQGLALLVFPEGTRSRDGRLQRGEPGVAYFVTKSGAPVVPCAVLGTDIMWPPGSRWLRPAKLRVIFGNPIFFTPDSDREEVVLAIMRAIAALLTEHGRPSTPAEDRTDAD